MVIVRAIGPSLTVNDKLADPTLDLYDGNGTPLANNDNWVDSGQAGHHRHDSAAGE